MHTPLAFSRPSKDDSGILEQITLDMMAREQSYIVTEARMSYDFVVMSHHKSDYAV